MFNNQNQNGIHLEINKMFDNIKLSDVITLDKSVNTNFTKYSTSVSVGLIDFQDMKEHVYSDIIQAIGRKCVKELMDNSITDFLDLSKYDNDVELVKPATDELIDYIINSGYKKCILSSMLASVIQDDIRFHFKAMNQNITINGADIYSIGFLSTIELFIDPYMRFNDNIVLLINDLRLNVNYIDSEIKSDATFTPRIVIDFNMFSSYDSKICYVVDKMYSNNYNKYLAELRDKKIDTLLND